MSRPNNTGNARRRLVDAAMRRLISLGGAAVLVAVIGMLALILCEAAPLFRPARLSPATESFDFPLRPLALAVAANLHGDAMAVGWIEPSGAMGVELRSVDGGPSGSMSVSSRHAPPTHPTGNTEARVLDARPGAGGTHTVWWDDGALALLRFTPVFSAAGGSASGSVAPFAVVATDPGFGPATLARMAGNADEGVAVAYAEGRGMRARRWAIRRKGLRRTRAEAIWELGFDARFAPTCLAATANGDTVWAGTRSGEILTWRLPDDAQEGGEIPPRLTAEVTPANRSRAAITALATMAGERSLAAGDAEGVVTAWHIEHAEEKVFLRRAREWPATGRAVAALAASETGRQLAVRDDDGRLRFFNTTTGALSLEETPKPESTPPFEEGGGAPWALSVDGAWMAARDAGTVRLWRLDDPHPEAGWAGYLEPLRYEGYDAPAWVWQSTGAEDSEPKLSLAPLLFGTAKGTLYAMLFAVPLALLSALYVSQFAPPALRGWIKPAVELMAAAPSVVVGFLAALWLAPWLERGLIMVPLSVVTMTGAGLLFLPVWRRLRRRGWAKRVEKGWEFAAAALVLSAGLAAAWGLAGPVEAALFDGDLPRWLYERAGLRYDQRNALVVSFALGFAVIPVVFSLAEDALSAVPPTLAAGALALGASRWQTAWRVVTPAAAPGLFAAAMIGFGRAVGETMIVLMATGNTPLMDASPFNGMRTLSANIAVEMPEAPVGGTLYRTLFLCAVLLFVFTFILNTAAEVVRRGLDKRHGRV